MKIRVEGTRAEVDATTALLGHVLDVHEVSRFYPNRGASVLGRVYLTVAAPNPDVVRAWTERLDQHRQITPAPGKEITS